MGAAVSVDKSRHSSSGSFTQSSKPKSWAVPDNTITGHWSFLVKEHVQCLCEGGRSCTKENPAWQKGGNAIPGLHSSWVTSSVLAMARPWQENVFKFSMAERFKEENIGMILNLQEVGEHDSCGPGNLPNCGFTYNPETFMAQRVGFYNFSWRDMGVPTLDKMMDIVQVMHYVTAVEGRRIAVHCHAGLGRTGLAIACFLVFNGDANADEAVLLVRKGRPGALQTAAQVMFVSIFEQYLQHLRVADLSKVSLARESYLPNRLSRRLSSTSSRTLSLNTSCTTSPTAVLAATQSAGAAFSLATFDPAAAVCMAPPLQHHNHLLPPLVTQQAHASSMFAAAAAAGVLAPAALEGNESDHAYGSSAAAAGGPVRVLSHSHSRSLSGGGSVTVPVTVVTNTSLKAIEEGKPIHVISTYANVTEVYGDGLTIIRAKSSTAAGAKALGTCSEAGLNPDAKTPPQPTSHDLGLDRRLPWNEHFHIDPAVYSAQGFVAEPPGSYMEALRRQQRLLHGVERRQALRLHKVLREAAHALSAAARDYTTAAAPAPSSSTSTAAHSTTTCSATGAAAAASCSAMNAGDPNSASAAAAAHDAAAQPRAPKMRRSSSTGSRGANGSCPAAATAVATGPEPCFAESMLLCLEHHGRLHEDHGGKGWYQLCRFGLADGLSISEQLTQLKIEINNGDYSQLAVAPGAPALLLLDEWFRGFAEDALSESSLEVLVDEAAALVAGCSSHGSSGSSGLGRASSGGAAAAAPTAPAGAAAVPAAAGAAATAAHGDEASKEAARHARAVCSTLTAPEQELFCILASVLRSAAIASAGAAPDSAVQRALRGLIDRMTEWLLGPLADMAPPARVAVGDFLWFLMSSDAGYTTLLQAKQDGGARKTLGTTSVSDFIGSSSATGSSGSESTLMAGTAGTGRSRSPLQSLFGGGGGASSGGGVVELPPVGKSKLSQVSGGQGSGGQGSGAQGPAISIEPQVRPRISYTSTDTPRTFTLQPQRSSSPTPAPVTCDSPTLEDSLPVPAEAGELAAGRSGRRVREEKMLRGPASTPQPPGVPSGADSSFTQSKETMIGLVGPHPSILSVSALSDLQFQPSYMTSSVMSQAGTSPQSSISMAL